MAVRRTESRVPGGFTQENLDKLGEAKLSNDGNYALVSYLTSPLRADPTLLKLRNRYVVFVNTEDVAVPDDYEWVFEFFGADPAIPVHTTSTITTDIGVYSLDAGEIPEVFEASLTRVILTVTLNGVPDPIVINQTVIKLFSDIEGLIISDEPESIARGGNPATTRSIANRYRSYIVASESSDPLTGVPPNLVAAITYLMMMAYSDNVFDIQTEAWEDYVNGAGDATTVPKVALGVMQLYPPIVSMFVDGGGNPPGVMATDTWVTETEAYGVYQSRVSLAFHSTVTTVQPPLPPTESSDYVNILRFPKSAFKVARVVLDARLAQHQAWAVLPRAELVELREAIEVLTSECEVGSFEAEPKLTSLGKGVFNKMFTPFIRAMVQMALYDRIGSYEIRNAAGNAIPQFPLYPGTKLTQAVPNLTAATTLGLADVVLAVPDEATLIRTSTPNTSLTQQPAAAGVNSTPIYAETGLDSAQLTFLLDVGHTANPFVGTLHLEVQSSEGAREVDIPLQVRPRESENSLFIPLSLVQRFSDCTWIRLQASSNVGGATVEGAITEIKFLRDNRRVQNFNRHYPAITVAGGLLSGNEKDVIGPQPRSTIGVPINWPLLFDVRAANFVNCVKMLELTAAQRVGHHNNNPHVPTAISLQPTGSRSLAGRRIIIDPGHGVAYNANARRCYEWFLAHRIGARVHTLLVNEHGVADTDIIHMRTAGLALINPGLFVAVGNPAPPSVPANWPPANAPEQGDGDYEYDMINRTVRIVRNVLSLTHISNLLLTTHDDEPPFAAQLVADVDRPVILAENSALIGQCIARTIAGLPNRTAVVSSERWNAPTQRYVFDSVPTANPAGASITHNIFIGTGDQWVVSDDSLRRLAERTSKWSLLREGLDNGAFSNAIRTAMLNQGALNYMVDAVLDEVDLPAPNIFLNHGIKGWSFGRRRSVMRATVPVPDIILTLHHNALPADGAAGQGLVMLAADAASATASHLRLQKTFVKYVTGLNKGLRQRGIINNHPSAINGPANAALIPRFAFFEIEFMNAGSDDPGLQFDYEQMVRSDFIEQTAQEIVAGIVDFLVNPQPNAEFDPIDVGAGIVAGGVRW
jgi:N-acetylmuramoyl-L-alanine amidase